MNNSYPPIPSNTDRLEAFMYFCGCDNEYGCNTIQPRIIAISKCENPETCWYSRFGSHNGEHRKQIWEGEWTDYEEYKERCEEGREACLHYGITTDEFNDD